MNPQMNWVTREEWETFDERLRLHDLTPKQEKAARAAFEHEASRGRIPFKAYTAAHNACAINRGQLCSNAKA